MHKKATLQSLKCEKAKNSGAVEEFLNVIGASQTASVKPIHKTNPPQCEWRVTEAPVETHVVVFVGQVVVTIAPVSGVS